MQGLGLIILTSLTLLTWNTHQLGQGAGVKKNDVVHYLQEQDADVICLEEVEVRKDGSGMSLEELRRAMRKYKYTYYDFKIYNQRRQYGNVVFSKYPLINKHTLRYESKGNISSCCDVVVDNDTIRLMVNYLESNRISSAERTEEPTAESLRRMAEKWFKAESKRKEQAEVVHQAVTESPYPVLVVGDMNTLPLSPTYRKMGDGLQDCYRETHWVKKGGTYCLHGFWVRIDFVFADRKMKVKECKVDYDAKGSDHQPIRAKLEI